jgi:hypothetical protein
MPTGDQYLLRDPHSSSSAERLTRYRLVDGSKQIPSGLKWFASMRGCGAWYRPMPRLAMGNYGGTPEKVGRTLGPWHCPLRVGEKVGEMDVSPTICRNMQNTTGSTKKGLLHTFKPSRMSYLLPEVETSISKPRGLPCTSPD